MKKLNVLLAIFLGWNAQTFAAEVATLGSLLDDPVVTLSTNMRTILRTSSLDKATCSAEQKDALADQAMQVFTSNIPRLMQFVPFERQNNACFSWWRWQGACATCCF